MSDKPDTQPTEGEAPEAPRQVAGTAPAADAGPAPLCPACRLEIQPESSLCPHCGTYHGAHRIWHRAGVYLPVLSLVVAIVSMAPGVIDALSGLVNPDTAHLVVLNLDTDAPGLSIEVANFGGLPGAVSAFADCDLPGTGLTLVFHATETPLIDRAGAHRLSFGNGAELVLGPAHQPDAPRVPLDPLPQLAELPTTVANAFADFPAHLRETIRLPEATMDLVCKIQVAGVNQPPPITVEVQIAESVEGESWSSTITYSVPMDISP